ncbi:MAG: NADH-quinone oxidoreductase subunit H [Lentisphaeria bacterium]|nr:NADH-quinone oxidoreductase subunit H [Lentisphaeria bacterium]
MIYWILNLILALLLAPVLFGVLNKVKAFFAGRKGPRIMQTWYDIFKLLRKGTVYSTSTTWIFKFAPVGTLAALAIAMLFLPLGFTESPLRFQGDALLFLYMLGLGRILTVLGALDTASSFEGMGAARELEFSIISEGTMLLLLIFLALQSGSCELSSMFCGRGGSFWLKAAPAMVLAAVALYVVLLTESCRVPVDDPETHLELTMIHEAMILDNSGPDLAFIHYGAGLKLWIFGAILTALVIPADTFVPWAATVIMTAGCFLIAVFVGITESMMARYRFLKVPQMLMGGFCMAFAALALLLISGGVK